jgi:predicted metal-dependent peptidase
MQKQTLDQKLKMAIRLTISRHRLFTQIIAGWNKVPTANIDTMATDGASLFWSPAFVEWCTLPELAWVILHEAGHCFLGHMNRIESGTKERKNIAFDLALNDRIAAECPPRLRAIVCFPGQGPYDHLPIGKKAEFYYSKLPEDPAQEPQSGESGAGEGGQGKSTPSDGKPGSGDPASPESMAKSQGEFDPSKSGTPGEVLPNPLIKEAGQETADAEWRKTVSRSLATAQQAGKVPGEWLEDAKTILQTQPVVDWKSALMRFMQRTCADGFTYTRPNRRTSYRRDMILPARRGRKSGHGAIVVDTSGSMSAADMAEVFGHLSLVFKSFPKATASLFECDTQCHPRAKDYGRSDMPPKAEDLQFKGRGGTDLTPAFKAVANGKFDWVIILSDMYFNYQNMPNPGRPTLWVKAKSTRATGVHKNFKPPFGSAVEVK